MSTIYLSHNAVVYPLDFPERAVYLQNYSHLMQLIVSSLIKPPYFATRVVYKHIHTDTQTQKYQESYVGMTQVQNGVLYIAYRGGGA